MSNPERLRAISQANYARAFDGVKFLAAGNGSGALAMVTALHSLDGTPIAATVFVKVAAVVFACGVFSSALAYRFIFSAVIDFDEFAQNIRPNGPDENFHQRGVKAYRRGAYAAFVFATSFFFVAFFSAFIALLLYVLR